MEKNIDVLNISKKKLQELQKIGYLTSEAVSNNLKVLERIEIDVDVWSKANKPPVVQNCADLLDEENATGAISTGNKDLDVVFRNEMIPGKIVELCGLPGSGKTQVCLQLSIAVQLYKLDDDTNCESVFICTNSNFSSRRLKEFAEDFYQRCLQSINEDSVESIIKRVHYKQVNNLIEMFACLKLVDRLSKEHKVKIIIIDSISYLLRQINMSDRTVSAYRLLRKLLTIAQDNKILVIVTNDMTTKVDLKKTFTAPSFGESFSHGINSRILLSKKSAGVFNASLIKSATSPLRSANFHLGFG